MREGETRSRRPETSLNWLGLPVAVETVHDGGSGISNGGGGGGSGSGNGSGNGSGKVAATVVATAAAAAATVVEGETDLPPRSLRHRDDHDERELVVGRSTSRDYAIDQHLH